jgi:hypothetical protein
MWRDVQRRCQIREYRLPEAPRRAVMYMIAGGGRWEPGAKVFVRQWLSEKPVLRYSIVHPHRIVDPPNGRIPPLAGRPLAPRAGRMSHEWRNKEICAYDCASPTVFPSTSHRRLRCETAATARESPGAARLPLAADGSAASWG